MNKRQRLEDIAALYGSRVAQIKCEKHELSSAYYKACENHGVIVDPGHRLIFCDENDYVLSTEEIQRKLQLRVDMWNMARVRFIKERENDNARFLRLVKRRYGGLGLIYAEMFVNDLFDEGINIQFRDNRFVTQEECLVVNTDVAMLYRGFPVQVYEGKEETPLEVDPEYKSTQQALDLLGFYFKPVDSAITDLYRCVYASDANCYADDYYLAVKKVLKLPKNILLKMKFRNLKVIYRNPEMLQAVFDSIPNIPRLVLKRRNDNRDEESDDSIQYYSRLPNYEFYIQAAITMGLYPYVSQN